MTAVIDSSVLVAVMRGEPESDHFAAVLRSTPRFVGWLTLFETRIVCIRHLPLHLDWLDQFVRSANTSLIAFDGTLETLASSAYVRFGKGRHPASLNFGDCMAYAVAKHLELPLLFKGGDFGRTDVRVHPASVIVEPPR